MHKAVVVEHMVAVRTEVARKVVAAVHMAAGRRMMVTRRVVAAVHMAAGRTVVVAGPG